MKKAKIAGSVLLIAAMLMSSCSGDKDSKDKKKKDKSRDAEVEETEAEETKAEETTEAEETETTETSETEPAPTEPEEEKSKRAFADELMNLAVEELNATPYKVYGSENLTVALGEKGVIMTGDAQSFKDYVNRFYEHKTLENERVRLSDIDPKYADSVKQYSCYYKCTGRGDEKNDALNVLRAVAVEFDSAETAKEAFAAHFKDGSQYADIDSYFLYMNKEQYIEFCIAERAKEYEMRNGIKYGKADRLREELEEELSDSFVAITGEIRDGQNIITIDLKSQTGDITATELIAESFGGGKPSESTFGDDLRDQLIDSYLDVTVAGAPDDEIPDYKIGETTFKKTAESVLGIDKKDFEDVSYGGSRYNGDYDLYFYEFDDAALAKRYFLSEAMGAFATSRTVDFTGACSIYPYYWFMDANVPFLDQEDGTMYGGVYLSEDNLICIRTFIGSDETKAGVDKFISELGLPVPSDSQEQVKFDISEGTSNPDLTKEQVVAAVNSAVGSVDEDWEFNNISQAYSLSRNLHNSTTDKISVSWLEYGDAEMARFQFDNNYLGQWYLYDKSGFLKGEKSFSDHAVLLNCLDADTDRISDDGMVNLVNHYGGYFLIGDKILAVKTNSMAEEDKALVDDILTQLGLQKPAEFESAVFENEHLPKVEASVDYSQCCLAYWDDINHNFTHDAEDGYYLDDKIVSMKDWYEQVALNPNLKMTSDDFLARMGSYNDYFNKPEALPSNEYFTWTDIEIRDPGGPDMCTVTYPKITIGGEACEAANADILNRIDEASDPELFVWLAQFAGDEYITFVMKFDNKMWSYTFDREGNLLNNDQILAAAGWDRETFDATATLRVTEIYLHIMDLKCIGEECSLMNNFYDYSAMVNSLQDPFVFLNQNGEPVVFVNYKIFDTPINGDFFLPIEHPDKALSDTIPEIKEPKDILGKNRKLHDYIASNTSPAALYPRVSKTEIDVTEDLKNSLVSEETSHGAVGDFAHYSNVLRLCYPVLLNEEDSLRAEVYKDGELIAEVQGEIYLPGYRIGTFDISQCNTKGLYCILVYMPNDPDQVVYEVHYKRDK